MSADRSTPVSGSNMQKKAVRYFSRWNVMTMASLSATSSASSPRLKSYIRSMPHTRETTSDAATPLPETSQRARKAEPSSSREEYQKSPPTPLAGRDQASKR